MIHRDVWSIGLGRWGGVYIRIHLFFLLFATFTGYLAWQLAGRLQIAGGTLGWSAAICLGVLLLSVLIHELGHWWAVVRMGGRMEAIVLGPLGGLHPLRMPHDPQGELLATMAGPLASLAVCVVFLAAAALTSDLNALKLLHPISPVIVNDGSWALPVWHWQTIIRLTCWINWLLLLVNLIPAFPFDGGRACLAFLRAARPEIDPVVAVRVVARLAKLFALFMLVCAWIYRNAQPESVVPPWLALVLLAIFVFFSARVEEEEAEPDDAESDLFGYDFSQGFTSLEKSQRESAERPGPITRWWRRLQLRRQIRRRALEADDERQLDEILMRLHQHGFEELSTAEKSLLRRVSARYRSRESS